MRGVRDGRENRRVSRTNGRSAPFPGFSRGIPLVGQRPEAPPKGRHYYHVPVLIQRPGQPLEADAYECYFPMPMNGIYFQALQKDITGTLTVDGQPAPKVIALQPVFLGFVPQKELDRQERDKAEKKVELVQ